jgi:sarcosine oxidase, subunit gamma
MGSRVLDPCSIIRVQTWDAKALAPLAVEDVLGVAWPQKTGTVALGRAEIICLGPTDWLVVATEADADVWLDRIAEAFDGSAFRATNVSDALTCIEIDGADVRDLLAKGCSLDLHPPQFPPGRAARTRLAGMPVVVHCTGASTFKCIVTLSYTVYLLSWLADAMLEFEAAT